MLYKKILALLQVFATSIFGFCELNITTIPPRTQPGISNLSDYYEIERYTPLEQLRPVIEDPEHLFNLIYDAQEPDCIQVRLERFSAKSSLSIYPDCRNWIDSMAALRTTQVSPEFCESHKSCYRCDNKTVQIAKSFNGFAREQLRLNFLLAEGLLLMEDLSSRGPQGLWMMLRKDKLRNRPCKCEKLRLFAVQYNKLYSQIHLGIARKEKARPEQSGTILLIWIMGSIAVPVFVLIVCVCLKLLF